MRVFGLALSILCLAAPAHATSYGQPSGRVAAKRINAGALNTRQNRSRGAVDRYGRTGAFVLGNGEAIQKAGFKDASRYANYRYTMGLR